jgi:pimeloyl-ACP methyl ester carboxylesterase
MKIRITLPFFIPLLFFVFIASQTEVVCYSVNPKVKSVDGTEIVYTSSGKSKTALVFVHGWSCDKSYWNEQVKVFVKEYQVVTIDLAGHGESGTERKDYTIQFFGKDVAAVVNELKLENVILIGHSMGGSVILEAAKELGSRIVGLIGVDTYQSFTDDWSAEQKEKFLEPFVKDFKTSAIGFVKQMFPKGADELLVNKIAEDMSSAPQKVAVSAMRNLFFYDPLPTLAKINTPIISVNSDMYPLSQEANQKYVKSFLFKMMKGVGHFLMLERTDEFNKLLKEAILEITKS